MPFPPPPYTTPCPHRQGPTVLPVWRISKEVAFIAGLNVTHLPHTVAEGLWTCNMKVLGLLCFWMIPCVLAVIWNNQLSHRLAWWSFLQVWVSSYSRWQNSNSVLLVQPNRYFILLCYCSLQKNCPKLQVAVASGELVKQDYVVGWKGLFRKVEENGTVYHGSGSQDICVQLGVLTLHFSLFLRKMIQS